MIDDQSDNLSQRITGEHVLLVGLVIVSAYMFLESYSFREPSGLFPRFIAGVTVVAALFLLLSDYLPEPLKALTEESGDLFSSHEEEIERVSQKKEGEETRSDVEEDSPDMSTEPSDTEPHDESGPLQSEGLFENKRLRLTVLTTGYVVLSYLVGFLFATPVFVLVYSLSVKHKWYVTAGLTIVTYTLVDGFMVLLNVQLDSGVLVG